MNKKKDNNLFFKSIGNNYFFFSRPPFLLNFNENKFKQYRDQLFLGKIINYSEKCAAWHTEFRNPTPCKVVQDSLLEIKQVSDQIREKKFLFNVTDVVNIGIGGSDWGPKLICEAFSEEINGPAIHFISNLDHKPFVSLLKKLSAKNTLFIVTSKSFKTEETIENMQIAKEWLEENHCEFPQHTIAITNNISIPLEKYAFLPSHVLTLPKWIGGRFSLWSAVGLSCAIALGYEKWQQLHVGAFEMDQHFYHTPLSDNLPVQYAGMLNDALRHDLKTLAILPYSHALRALPHYLQQLFMESLGKSVSNEGEPISYPTGPVVYGSEGTNSQHSFQQMMMQGTHPVFADFILPLANQPKMVTNCLMQVKALREGNADPDLNQNIIGNKMANLWVLDPLNLKSLGCLLAFYEHAVVTTACFLNINPFDQWGVEYAKRCNRELSNEDFSTVEKIKRFLKKI